MSCDLCLRLAALALLVLQSEEDAFWCLVAVVEVIMPQDYYTKNLVASQVRHILTCPPVYLFTCSSVHLSLYLPVLVSSLLPVILSLFVLFTCPPV